MSLCPMRILLINSEYPPVGGGAGNASAHLARVLAPLGHEVALVTAHFRGTPRMETQDGVTVHRIPAMRRRQDRSGALEQLAFIVSASFWTFRLIRQSKPDATLAFFGVPSGAVAWMLKKLFHIPYIVSLRGGDVPGFRPYDFKTMHKLLAPLLRVIWHDASAVVANSRGLRDLALAFDSSIEIPIIPNGVDVSQYIAEDRAWSPPRLLSVGRIVHQKGLDLAMRALAGLKDLEWEWRIAGDGPQTEPLQSLAQELGIADRVIFLGWQSREELAKWYHQSNTFLFPSRHEGMPNAVLEAMASGLPVAATRIAGSEELVLDGETGFLVPSENVDALRDALRNLLTDASLRKRMGAASRVRVEQNYTWKKVAEAYQTALQQAARPARTL
jgi:glycosyltransferase involved in cell wall biosynthesis